MDQKLKIKLLEDKPRKVFAVRIEYDFHLEELCDFLTNQTDKKFDVIINGHLIKFSSSIGKNKFVEGFSTANKILSAHILSAFEDFKREKKELLSRVNYLKDKNTAAEEIKKEYLAKSQAMEISVAAWKDRITELEDTCETLSVTLKKLK